MLNKLFNKLEDIRNILMCRMTTFLQLTLLVLKGVTVKNGTRFYGFSKFRLASGSKVYIGEKCSFRSKHTSNLIGINHPCIISTHSKEAKITIGDNCGFSGAVIGCFSEIKIGNNVRVGANVVITDGDWHMDDKRIGSAKPVVIENNVWLGYGVVVLKGVSVGENSIIGAGSVVTTDIPSGVIASGNPCKVIRLIGT